jgi:hypothetical protein
VQHSIQPQQTGVFVEFVFHARTSRNFDDGREFLRKPFPRCDIVPGMRHSSFPRDSKSIFNNELDRGTKVRGNESQSEFQVPITRAAIQRKQFAENRLSSWSPSEFERG